MPISELRIEITPDGDTFTPTLMGIEKRAIDLLPAYAAVYQAFRVIEAKRFSGEGPGWAPLAESTVAGRVRIGIDGSHPILNRSGASYEGRKGGQLRRSLTTKGAKGAVFEPQIDGVFMGTKDPIARFHQEGTSKMKARPVVDLTEADASVFGSIIGEYLYGFGVDRTLLGDSMYVADAMGL